MSKMGRYCKAYPIAKLHEFSDWAKYYRGPEKVENSEEDYLFLQENFTVTKGIFQDEEIVFDNDASERVEHLLLSFRASGASRGISGRVPISIAPWRTRCPEHPPTTEGTDETDGNGSRWVRHPVLIRQFPSHPCPLLR